MSFKDIFDSMAYNSLLICRRTRLQEDFQTSGYVQEAQCYRRQAYLTLWHLAVFKAAEKVECRSVSVFLEQHIK